MATTNSYGVGLERNFVNGSPFSPLNILQGAEIFYPKRISVISGSKQYTRKESYKGCRSLDPALMGRDIGKDDPA